MDGTELDESSVFDDIVNGTATAEIQTNAVEPVAQERDEAGKFAPKQDADTDAVVDTDNAAQTAVEGDHGKGKVPVAAVQAEREKARVAREEAEALRRDMAELRGQVSVLTQQRQEPAKTVEPVKAKNFWESPDEFFAEKAAPLQQSITQQRFEMSRMMADDKFGTDTVKAADDALGELMKANDPAVLVVQQKVMNARHPYAELVKWHEGHKAMAEIGNDPAAFRTAERERIRAELMAELGIEAQPNPPVVHPSNPAKPLTKLPQSLHKLSGAGNGGGDVDASDAGMFATITGARR